MKKSFAYCLLLSSYLPAQHHGTISHHHTHTTKDSGGLLLEDIVGRQTQRINYTNLSYVVSSHDNLMSTPTETEQERQLKLSIRQLEKKLPPRFIYQEFPPTASIPKQPKITTREINLLTVMNKLALIYKKKYIEDSFFLTLLRYRIYSESSPLLYNLVLINSKHHRYQATLHSASRLLRYQEHLTKYISSSSIYKALPQGKIGFIYYHLGIQHLLHTKPEAALDAFQKAQKYYQKLNMDTIRAQKRWANLHFWLGMLHYHYGKKLLPFYFEISAQIYEHLDKRYLPILHNRLVQIYQQSDQKEKAYFYMKQLLSYYSQSIDQQPIYWQMVYKMALLKMHFQQWEEALSILNQVYTVTFNKQKENKEWSLKYNMLYNNSLLSLCYVWLEMYNYEAIIKQENQIATKKNWLISLETQAELKRCTGTAYRKKQNHAKALLFYQEALKDFKQFHLLQKNKKTKKKQLPLLLSIPRETSSNISINLITKKQIDYFYYANMSILYFQIAGLEWRLKPSSKEAQQSFQKGSWHTQQLGRLGEHNLAHYVVKNALHYFDVLIPILSFKNGLEKLKKKHYEEEIISSPYLISFGKRDQELLNWYRKQHERLYPSFPWWERCITYCLRSSCFRCC